MSQPIWVEVAGWLGSLLVVAAYALNIMGRLRADAPAYLWANIVGSVGLIINTGYVGAYPSACVNVIWVFIGVWGIAKQRRVILKRIKTDRS